MNSAKHKHLVWDWNGTLLNDVQAALDSINEMLAQRNLPTLDVPRYRAIFGFPVINCYRVLGFQFQTDAEWDSLAREFHRNYFRFSTGSGLSPGVVEALNRARKHGIRMSVLSASEHTVLKQKLESFGIIHFFDNIYGHTNLYGDSKIELGRTLLAQLNIHPSSMMLIGDTTHDFEVAHNLGLDCRLYLHGHQDEARLRACGCPVFTHFDEIS